MSRIILLALFVCFSVSGQVTIRNGTVRNATINKPSTGGGGGNTVFVTGTSGGTTHPGFTGNVGFAFIASTNATVTDLGRLVQSGNLATHNVLLIHFTSSLPSAGTVIATATAVPTSGVTANTYSYLAVTTASLVLGDTYGLVSAEVNAGDTWLNDNQTLTTTALGVVQGSIFSSGGVYAYNTLSSGRAFVPPNLKYTIP